MKFDGVLGDGELRRDFFVAEAAPEHLQNFAFARSKRFGKFFEPLRPCRGGRVPMGADRRQRLRGMCYQ